MTVTGSVGTSPSGTLSLSTTGGPSVAVEHLAGLWCRQRDRLSDAIADLDDQDWCLSSRCQSWTVGDVVAHLADGARRLMPCFSADAGGSIEAFHDMDPRTDPSDWIAGGDRTPARLLLDHRDATERLFGMILALRSSGAEREVWAPYRRRIPWQLLVVHGVFDHWMHERDVLLPLGRRHGTTAEETRVAAAYSVLIASVTAGVSVHLHATGTGGGCLRADGVAGEVLVSDVGGCRAVPDVIGEAVVVPDALTGRTAAVGDVLDGPEPLLGPIGLLADWFRSGP